MTKYSTDNNMKHLVRKSIMVLLLFWGAGSIYLANGQETKTDSTYHAQLNRVQSFIQSGQFAEAINLLDELIAEHPSTSDAYYIKSLLLAKGSMFEPALPLAQEAFKLDPKNLLYANHLIALFKETGNLSGALEIVNDLQKVYPDMQSVYTEKMMLLAASNKTEEASSAYREASAKFGASDTLDILHADLLVGSGKYNEAMNLLEPYKAQKSNLPQVYSLLAGAYVGNKNYRKATSTLEEGLNITKSNLLYLDIADVYRTRNNTKKAADALKKALMAKDIEYIEKMRVMNQVIEPQSGFSHQHKQELIGALMSEHPKNPDVYSLKGDIAWQAGNLDEAELNYLRAVEIYPQHIDTWRKSISARIEKKDIDKAIDLGLEGLAKNPGNTILEYLTGVAYMIKEDHGNARKYLESALNNSERENNFVRSMIYSSLGDLYHTMDMVTVSDVAYEEAIALDSANATALNNLAYYLALRKKDLDKAEQYAHRAVSLEPSSGTFQDTYAWVLFQQGKYKDAQVWIEKAVKNSTPSAVLHEHYGDILIKQGKDREATKQWEKALNLASGTKAIDQEKIKEKIREKKYIE